MRSITFHHILIGLMMSTAAWGQLRLDPGMIELGVVKAGDARTATVTLSNAGTRPISIQRAEVSCGRCTFVHFEPTVLDPGRHVDVSIRFAPPISEGGLVQRDVAFITSKPTLLPPKVWIQAYITHNVGWWPAKLFLRKPQKPGTKIHQMIDLVNVSEKSVKLGSATEPADGPRILLPKMIQADKTVHVPLDWTLPAKPGEYSGGIKVNLPGHSGQGLEFVYDVRVGT
ncbi:MAG TPA: DUF1573 domain-containing protein [Tepidisphaeraceae bacterium]|nr:DUF1573 domain-containing protein [Tepidisphaeraceae bacterium]